jgi:DNA-binding response OmpR family regulator
MAGKRILIVDDDTDLLQTLGQLLSDSGHVVECATNPLYALDVARTFHPQFVLLDIGLPYMDGYETVRRFRAAFNGARIFAITGRASEQDRAKSLAAGFENHFVKPLDFTELEKLVA